MFPLLVATSNKGKVKEFNQLLEPLSSFFSITSYADLPNGGPDIDEPYETFRENAATKAFEAAKILNISTLSDDSGLCVDALNGDPGVYSARYAARRRGTDIPKDQRDAENIIELHQALHTLESTIEDKTKINRKAYYIAVIGIALRDIDFIEIFGKGALENLPTAGTLPEAYDQFYRKEGFVIGVCEGRCHGTILDDYRGDGGFGYDPVFLIDSLNKTAAEMTLDEKNQVSHRRRACEKLEKMFAKHLK